MELYVRVVPTQQLYVGVFPTQQMGPHATGIPSTEAVLRSPGQCRPAPQGGHSPGRLNAALTPSRRRPTSRSRGHPRVAGDHART